MPIFNMEKVNKRILITFFGVKFSFKLPFAAKNKYVVLGDSCFARRMLTSYGVKASRRQGEKSCPFDLILFSVPKIVDMLENNFEGFIENLAFSEEKGCWVETTNDILFLHDKFCANQKNLLMERYQKRIVNLYEALHSIDKKIFVSVITIEDSDIESVNRVYNYLEKSRKGDFEYAVFYLNTSGKEFDTSMLNTNIKFLVAPTDQNYRKNWFASEMRNKPEAKKIEKEFVNFIRKL